MLVHVLYLIIYSNLDVGWNTQTKVVLVNNIYNSGWLLENALWNLNGSATLNDESKQVLMDWFYVTLAHRERERERERVCN